MITDRSTRRRLVNADERSRPPMLKLLEMLGLTVVTLITISIFSIPVVFWFVPYRQTVLQTTDDAIMSCREQRSVYNASIVLEQLNCSQDFYYNNETQFCHPYCHSWTQYSHSVATSIRILEGLTSGLGICFSIATLVISGLRYKTIFTFPTIFIIYAAISYAIRDSFYLISSLATANLYCSSDDLFYTTEHPTAFCIISGVVNQYTSVIVTYWWLCLIGVTFHKLVCPFQARSLQVQGYYRHIHVLLVVVGVLLPLPGVVAAFATDKYNIDAFPALVCLAGNPGVHFYSTTFINVLLTSVYSILLILITWIIHKHEGLFNSCDVLGVNLRFSITERKLVSIFFLNLLFGSVFFINSALYNAQKKHFVDALRQYFICEACGVGANGQSCDRQEIERFAEFILVFFFELSIALLPLGPLLYVNNWSATKKYLTRLCCHKWDSSRPIVREMLVISGHAQTSSTPVDSSAMKPVSSSSSSSPAVSDSTSKDVQLE